MSLVIPAFAGMTTKVQQPSGAANAVAPGLVITEQQNGHFPSDFANYALSVTAAPRLGESEDLAAMVAMLMSDGGATMR